MKKLLLLLVLSLTSCSNIKTESLIMTSFAPIYDFTYQIIKVKYNIDCLVQDQELHSFTVTSISQRKKLEDALITFYYGHNLDNFIEDIENINTYNITENVNFHKIDNKNEDPHAFLSIKQSMIMLKNIYTKICELDPDNKDFYYSNYLKAYEEFNTLHNQYLDLSDSLTNKIIITSHDAFSYLEYDYNFKVKSINDIANNEPTISEITNLIQYIKDNNVHTLFLESLDSDKYLNIIKEELDKDNYSLTYKILSSYEEIDLNNYPSNTYLDVMKSNLNTLKEGLINE